MNTKKRRTTSPGIGRIAGGTSKKRTNTKGIRLESARIECDTTPRTSSDLHMHPKKITEIRNWLSKPAPRGILFLTGPPGSGKTSAVRVISDELKIPISEWIEPDHEIEESSFVDFVRARPMRRNAALLIRHLPYSMYSDLSLLYKLLRSIPPSSSIIFCLPSTLTSWNLNPGRLFNSFICNELSISQITTNPFAQTFLIKAMKRVVSHTSDCRDAELSDIAKLADGDIRKAMIILDLRLRLGKGNAHDKADSPISIFHTVGRILYAKRKETTSPSWKKAENLLNNERMRRPEPDFDVNSLVEDSPHDSQKLISFVFEHSPRFTPASCLHKVFDAISIADSTLHVWNRRNIFDQYALQTVVRNSLFYNYRQNGHDHRSKYAFNNPLVDQLMKEMRKLVSENEVAMRWRKEYYTETVPMMSQMGVLPPSLEYFSHPVGSGVWKQGLDQWSGKGSHLIAKTEENEKKEKEEHVEFDIVETDDSDLDSF